MSADISDVPMCFQSVMLYLTPGMITLIAGLRGGCGGVFGLQDQFTNPPNQQLMLDKLSGHTSQHWAVFGTQADVFYETPQWEKLQLIQVMADEFLRTQHSQAAVAL